MKKHLVLPAYLALCLILGGSTQGIWANMALQLCAVALIAWSFTVRASDEPAREARPLLMLAGAAAAVALLQLVPLPAAIWTGLPLRNVVARGFEALGRAAPAQPISLAPYDGVAALLALLPAFAVLIVTLRNRQREGWAAAAILAAAMAGVLLGAMQVAGGGPRNSPWYLYDITNVGAVGFFANANHFGALLLATIPFAVALLAARIGQRGRRLAGTMVAAAVLLVVVVGIALNASLAALGLVVPVVLFSAPLLPSPWRFRRLILPLGALALAGSLALLAASPTAAGFGGAQTSIESRIEIWKGTAELIGRSFPVGTGLGTFESVYPLAEDPGAVRRVYINHAHNDYLELVLELGAAGILLILGFLAWWSVQAVRVWKSALSSHHTKAATIASGALLAHSLVDYPLRTAALSAVFAFCVALMARSRTAERAKRGDTPGARHVKIG